jgi:predicted Zn-dependent peptidase
VAGQLSELLVYSLPQSTLTNYVQEIQSVTAAQVRKAAEHYIDPDKMFVLLVGDRAVIEEDVKALNLGPLDYRDRMEGLESDF